MGGREAESAILSLFLSLDIDRQRDVLERMIEAVEREEIGYSADMLSDEY